MKTRLLAPMLAILVGWGCAANSDLGYAPSIQDTELRDGDDVKARVAVTWLGAKECETGGYELWFRVHVENTGAGAFQLEPAKFDLLDVILEPVGEARIEGLPAAVPAGADATFEVAFPLPRDGYSAELGALEFRMRLDGNRWDWSSRFRRVDGDAALSSYERWYGTPWAVRGGLAGSAPR